MVPPSARVLGRVLLGDVLVGIDVLHVVIVLEVVDEFHQRLSLYTQ